MGLMARMSSCCYFSTESVRLQSWLDGLRYKQNICGVLCWRLFDVWTTLGEKWVKSNIEFNLISWTKCLLNIVAISPPYSHDWLENDIKLNQFVNKATVFASSTVALRLLFFLRNHQCYYLLYILMPVIVHRACYCPSPIVNETNWQWIDAFFSFTHLYLTWDNVNCWIFFFQR